MATDMHPAHSGGRADRADLDWWQRAWSHREELLRVARRRSMSAEDAEDAVHEAMLRAAEHPQLDDERLGAWLTTVTIRLCVDRYRQVSREAEVRSSPKLVAPCPMPVDETVCDQAEARWLAARSGELPARQAEAIRLKSEDLDVGQVAKEMGLSYRTAESLLARARRTLRTALAATLGLALWLCGRGGPRTGGNAQLVTVAATAATLAVAGLVLPYVHDGDRPGPARPAPSVSDGAGDARNPGSGAPPSARSRPAASTTNPGTAPADGPLPVVPSLPEVPLPILETLTAVPDPDVPEIPLKPPEVSVPPAPSAPAAPSPSATAPSVRSPESSKTAPKLPGDGIVP
ncbi:sigma-70 family RNA polymerase sigma factor [Streptomyces halobius]|uniref:Sigma-70 family RNA polymerase sigma factor n=1 Tax=Streptomyces halobius TaxID=2879846 RepID=A0ABY4MH57_9ACTN|nr:sigma-70 family RNA polymerase sigma factor [Streptomyces halobius]UQA95740.1 sigma-70 family RNA polymerase sigma factor [Streptomyces halobius]